MPKIPKWMANAMESIFSGMYHPVQVTAIEDVATGLRKIRFEGDFSKSKKEFIAGNVIEFRISDTEFRHYTPSYFDQKNGICEVLFYLHDKGPGSRWVSKLQLHDKLNLLGPGGITKYNTSFQSHVVFGDETSLGLLLCIHQEVENRQHSFLGIAELDLAHQSWPSNWNAPISPVMKDGTSKGADAIRKLGELFDQDIIRKKQTAFYLTGNAKSILAVKKFLQAQGVSSKQIQTEPYWVEGKRGL